VEGEVGVLVMCHTRELAFQIAHEYERMGKYLPETRTSVFYGGMLFVSAFVFAYTTRACVGSRQLIIFSQYSPRQQPLPCQCHLLSLCQPNCFN